MGKSSMIAAAAVCLALTVAAPSFAATAANSQNGTNSSNPNVTNGPPPSTSAVPATDMQMGTTPGAMPTQDGSGMNGGGTMGTGGATAPKQ